MTCSKIELDAAFHRGYVSGAASRDAEVAELREYILSAHVLLSYRQGTSNDVPKKYADEAQSELEKALAATELGSTNQDKAALFKALGLVPWDNKPPACTDTVWIEPGKVAIKEQKEPKP